MAECPHSYTTPGALGGPGSGARKLSSTALAIRNPVQIGLLMWAQGLRNRCRAALHQIIGRFVGGFVDRLVMSFA